MSRQSKPASEHYEGKFNAKTPPAKPAKGLSRGVRVLIVLLLLAARFGAEFILAETTSRRFLQVRKTFADVDHVNLPEVIRSGDRSLTIVDGYSGQRPEGDFVLSYDDGTKVEYDGHTYLLNRNLTTILAMGIDRAITEETKLHGNGGQSDVLMLIGIDTETGQTNILNISREAYSQVQVYSGDGSLIRTEWLQICLAYAYGDGREKSCENAKQSVSRLLYDLDIQSYLAVDLVGILKANEAVGGVTVDSLVDVTMPDGTVVHKGDRIELHGKNAERYIRTRGQEIDANAPRMERQKQYITEFSKLVVSKSRSDLTYPATLFSSLSDYMVTDMEITDVTALARCFISNDAKINFINVRGTYGLLNGTSVCYLDEIDLFEAILQVFYQRVD